MLPVYNPNLNKPQHPDLELLYLKVSIIGSTYFWWVLDSVVAIKFWIFNDYAQLPVRNVTLRDSNYYCIIIDERTFASNVCDN